jgi:hypothetical protein
VQRIDVVPTSQMKARLLGTLGAALLASAACARSGSGCDDAIETVRRGMLATPQDQRAWATLPGCGASGGLAARDVWTSLRAVSDTARLAKVFEHLRSFRDSSLFAAAREVLLDSAATPPARVYSAMLVVAQVRPLAQPYYDDFTTTGPHDPCVAASVSDRPVHDGAPLPAHASQEVDSAAFRVMAARNVPQSVRSAARCMYDTVRGESAIFTPPSGMGHVRESAGRLDGAGTLRRDSVRLVRPASHARASAPADSIHGRIRLGGGGCVMQQAYLETDGGALFKLDGSRRLFHQLPGFADGHHPFHQLVGLDVVVFGRVSHRPRHPYDLPYPLFLADSFFVRAGQETRVHDGILRRGARGDQLEMRDGRRLPVANLPPTLQKADGMRVWIGEPLGAPTIAGVLDPAFRHECAE